MMYVHPLKVPKTPGSEIMRLRQLRTIADDYNEMEAAAHHWYLRCIELQEVLSATPMKVYWEAIRERFPDTFVNHLEIEDDILELIKENEQLKIALLAANADADALAEELRGEQNPGYTCYELRMHDNRVRIKSTEDSDGS